MSQDGQTEAAVFPQLINTSLADRARGAILTAILEGQFADRLPAEDVLARMLNVSRTTIRSALQGLEQEGIITRRRAIGTTINHHVGPATMALQRLVGFDWLLEEKHHKVKVETELEIGEPPADFREIFPLETGESCIHMRKTFMADGSPALWVRDVVPAANVHTVLDGGSTVPASLFEFSKLYCLEAIDHAVVELVPMVVRTPKSTKLDLKKGQPFIRLHETHYTSDATALGYSIIDVDDRYIRFEVFRRESS
jgi:GntR family transcriptional regulator